MFIEFIFTIVAIWAADLFCYCKMHFKTNKNDGASVLVVWVSMNVALLPSKTIPQKDY